MKLPAGFEFGRFQLDQLLKNLETCKSRLPSIQTSLPATVFASLEEIFESCEGQAYNIERTFKVLRSDASRWEEKYATLLAKFGTRNSIEELTRAISTEVEFVLNYVELKSLGPNPQTQADDISKAERTIISRTHPLVVTTNDRRGGQTNTVFWGSGVQVNNNAPIGVQYFHH